jgi:hypothetical protein
VRSSTFATLGERRSGFDGGQATGDELSSVCVVGMEEGFEADLVSTLRLQQRRPTGQEVAEQHGVALVEPFQNLRIVLLERVGQAVGQAGLGVDQFASALRQANQRTHGDALRVCSGHMANLASMGHRNTCFQNIRWSFPV